MNKTNILFLFCLSICQAGFSQTKQSDSLQASQQRLLTSVGKVLEEKHYRPQQIDDVFSQNIWQAYIKRLDPRKEIFLKSDIESLKAYEKSIDDEIQGRTSINFLSAVLKVYKDRYAETWSTYQKTLQGNFDFALHEKGLPATGYADFPATRKAKAKIDRRRVKFLVLQSFMASNKKKDAIAAVKKQLELQQKRAATPLTEEKQFGIFLNTIVKRMDPHSDYFAPQAAKSFQEGISNHFYGIGTQLQEKDGIIRIMNLEPGGPAEKSGLIIAGDMIIGVGEGKDHPVTDITGWPINDVTPLIRGTKGTTVSLSLKKADGSVSKISIAREEVIQADGLVKTAILREGSQKTGYIMIPGFYDDVTNPDGPHCARDVAAALSMFRAEDVSGIIVDLRSNGGGSLREVVKMVELFIHGGPVVQVRSRDKNPIALIDSKTEEMYNGPLVVMVNALTASASEIFTAAIQDYHRGIILGSTSTYGKGSVQSPVSIDGSLESGQLKLTQQLFYRVNGNTTQMRGVKSDIVLPDIYEYQKIREKDNDFFLAFDTIAPSKYIPDNSLDYPKVKELAGLRLKTDTTFSILEANIALSAKDQTADLPLDMAAEKKLTLRRKQMAKRTESLLKLPEGKEMTFAALQKDKAENQRYQQWIKKVNADVYIDQAVKVLMDILNTLPV